MKEQSLLRKSLTQFIACVAVLLLLATPLFYGLTKNFYAEDMIDIISAVKRGKDIPNIDIERDIMQGVMLQFGLITAILGIAIVLTMRFIARRMWRPFDKTLNAIDTFRLESGTCPRLEESDVKEFARLNLLLGLMMKNSLHSYKIQKEFTENASHELQTPLAIFQSKLDLLLQQPNLTEKQAGIIQDLYQMNSRLSRLNRNLLLLAKMENGQFSTTEQVNITAMLDELMPYLESLADGLRITKDYRTKTLTTKANRALLESLVNNLVVNAVRHNKPGGKIVVTVKEKGFSVANTSNEPALDTTHIFNRFYRPNKNDKAENCGNGLGLAIAKAVCDYHNWRITYACHEGWHEFEVQMP